MTSDMKNLERKFDENRNEIKRKYLHQRVIGAFDVKMNFEKNHLDFYVK